MKNEIVENLRQKAREKLLAIRGKTIKSKDGVEARISSNSIGKMLHGLDNTLRNDYTAEQHYAAVLIIDELFSTAITVLTHKSNKRGDSANIIRLATPFNNEGVFVYITVREEIDPNQAGKRIYSIELIEIGRLGRHLEAVEINPAEFPSPTIYTNNINHLLRKSQ